MDQPEAEYSKYDQVKRDDVIEEPGHDQNENAGDQRDDWLEMRDAEDMCVLQNMNFENPPTWRYGLRSCGMR